MAKKKQEPDETNAALWGVISRVYGCLHLPHADSIQGRLAEVEKWCAEKEREKYEKLERESA